MHQSFLKRSIICSFSLLTLLLFSCDDSPSEEIKEVLSAEKCNFDGIKTGDIVLKRGNGRISKLIINYFKEKIPLSHSGIIICSPDSTYVIHSVSGSYARKDGVQTILLKELLNDCMPNYFYIVRKKTSNENNQAFASKAIAYSNQTIPFDDQADNADKTKMSCTELIYWCQMETYGKSDLTSIKTAGKEVFVFNGMLDSTKYDIIKHY
jgi:hypothetical protein